MTAGDVSAGGFDRSGRNLQRRLAQHVQNMSGIEAPNAIALQELGDRRFADAPRFAGRRREFPQVEHPGGAKVAFKLEHGGKVAPKLLTHAVCEPVALGAQDLR